MKCDEYRHFLTLPPLNGCKPVSRPAASLKNTDVAASPSASVSVRFVLFVGGAMFASKWCTVKHLGLSRCSYSKVHTSRPRMLKSCCEERGWLLKVEHLVVVPRYNSASSQRPRWPLQNKFETLKKKHFNLLAASQTWDRCTHPPPPICRESILPFTK